MPSRGQLALIHIAKKDLHLSDETYRDILFCLFHKNSARDLAPGEVNTLLAHFTRLGWPAGLRRPAGAANDAVPRLARKGFSGLGERPGMATPAQLRKIVALWMTGENVRRKDMAALRHFVNHHFHIADLRFITRAQVAGIIGAIKRMSGSEGFWFLKK